MRKFLEEESQDCQTVITESNLSRIVEKCLKKDMMAKSATGRMKLLFMEYKFLLRTNGLNLGPAKTPKDSISHFLSTIKPAQLRTGLDQLGRVLKTSRCRIIISSKTWQALSDIPSTSQGLSKNSTADLRRTECIKKTPTK